MNTFKGANTSFANRGIHTILAEVVNFREQLTVRPELKSRSGWDNAMNAYMVKELENLRNTIENLAYNPDNLSVDELGKQAADTNRGLGDDYNELATPLDNILTPGLGDKDIQWKLDGTDPDLPQITELTHPNAVGRAFITGLDELFCMLTRLDSRFQPYTITRYEASMLVAHLGALYTITQRKGGEDNRVDIPTGTLPSQEPNAFQG